MVPSCVSISVSCTTRSSSHRSSIITTKSAWQCDAVVFVNSRPLLPLFINTSTGNGYENTSSTVWCHPLSLFRCPSLPVRHHIDRESLVGEVHASLVQSCVSSSVSFSTHSSSHRSTMIVTRSACRCAAVVCIKYAVLLHPFSTTSIGNDKEDKCITVWCHLVCPVCCLPPLLRHHVDRESSPRKLHGSSVQSCMSIPMFLSTNSSSHHPGMVVRTSAFSLMQSSVSISLSFSIHSSSYRS